MAQNNHQILACSIHSPGGWKDPPPSIFTSPLPLSRSPPLGSDMTILGATGRPWMPAFSSTAITQGKYPPHWVDTSAAHTPKRGLWSQREREGKQVATLWVHSFMQSPYEHLLSTYDILEAALVLRMWKSTRSVPSLQGLSVQWTHVEPHDPNNVARATTGHPGSLRKEVQELPGGSQEGSMEERRL